MPQGSFALACQRIGHAVLDALLPPRCLACGTAVPDPGTLCADCFRPLAPLVPPWCDQCGLGFLHAGQGQADADGLLLCPQCLAHPPPFARARAAWLYDDGAKRLLLPFKHADRPELAGPIARQMEFQGRALLREAELILPVPLHRWRLLRRRYNQAALLAAALARRSGRPWAPGLLLRRRATPPLGPLGAAERAVLLADVFALAPGAGPRIAGRRLLLVDDVMTSGATAAACARLLLQAGAARVEVLAAARVPDPRLQEASLDANPAWSRANPLDRASG